MSEAPGAIDTGFRAALRRLDAAGRLVKVTQPLDVVDEVGGAMKAADGGLALLFEAPASRGIGHPIPVLGNFLSCAANVEAALGLDRHQIRQVMLRALDRPLPPAASPGGSGPVPAQERVIAADDIDLGADLPVLRHSPDDGGRFVTAGVVIVRDPDTGVHNASYHRLQLIARNLTAIKLDYGRHLRGAFESAQAAGAPLPIAVCVGTDVALMYAGAYMGSQMPADADELAAAGGLKGEPLALAPCLTQPLAVPAETEIVIEGVVHPDRTAPEGPFGEFVGYLSDSGPAPVFEATALTMRRDPVYHAINGAGRETVMLRKHVLEASALRALRQANPIVADAELTAGGLYRFHLVIQVAKRSARDEGMQRNAMLAAFAALKDLDQVVVVDDDIDITDTDQVEYAVATRVEGSKDIVFMPGMRGHEYVRVSDGGVRTKVGIDATVPFDYRDRFAGVRFAEVALDPAATSSDPGSSRLSWLQPRKVGDS